MVSSSGISEGWIDIIQSQPFENQFFCLNCRRSFLWDELHCLPSHSVCYSSRVELQSFLLLRPQTHIPLKSRSTLWSQNSESENIPSSRLLQYPMLSTAR